MFTYIEKMKSSKKSCSFFILLMIIIYIFENSTIAMSIDSRFLNYLIKPVIWLGLTFVVGLFPKPRPKGKLILRSRMMWWSFTLAFLYIIILVIAGLIDGLGKSPYNHSLFGIVTNSIYVGTMLVGREWVRNYLVNHLTKKDNYIIFLLIALFMTGTSISLNKYTNFKENIDILEFVAESFAPEFAHNLLATYLVFLGGPVISIIYLGTIKGFYWLFPILPDLKWITKALIGILYPTFALMTIQSLYMKASKLVRKRDDENPMSWIITSILSIGIIWFAVGIFPIYPSVIATGSMEPMIKPGDVIIVQKIDGTDVEIGDIIQFRRDKILISHRVIEIIEEESMKSYRTKGDNNGGPDSQLVMPEQIKGEIKYVVPKIGWLTLLIKSDKDVDLDDIEF